MSEFNGGDNPIDSLWDELEALEASTSGSGDKTDAIDPQGMADDLQERLREIIEDKKGE